MVCCCRPSSANIVSDVVRSRMMLSPLSAIQVEDNSSERSPAVRVSSRTKYRKVFVLPSDAALEVKKFSVSRT